MTMIKETSIRWTITFGSLVIIAFTLGAYIWKAAAQNARFEAACERQVILDKVLAEHTTTLALTNTSIAVINTKLDTIIIGQKEMKDEVTALRKEQKLNKINTP